VIPGGTPLSAQLDVARTIVRRAERATVRIQLAGELASTEILRFLNRASDLVFSMARYADVDFPDLFEGRRKSGDPEE
jgi:cob(I)alamin adenosyltransferase